MLYEFYGETCPHCIEMMPMVEKLAKELGVKVERLEVWNSEANAMKLELIDRGLCGGVPFFFNDENNDYICGSCDEDRLREWMKGGKSVK